MRVNHDLLLTGAIRTDLATADLSYWGSAPETGLRVFVPGGFVGGEACR